MGQVYERPPPHPRRIVWLLAVMAIVIVCLAFDLPAQISPGVPPNLFVTNSNITASPLQIQGAVPLDFGVNVLTTVATHGDSVTCPPEERGAVFQVENQGANAAQIFPDASETLGARSVDVPIILEPGGVLTIVGEGDGSWSLLADSSRTAWIDVVFDAGNFTGEDLMVWTVEEVDVITHRYKVIGGNMLLLTWHITDTTVSGTLNNQLNIALPIGYVADGQSESVAISTQPRAGPVIVEDTFRVTADGSILQLQAELSDTWQASTNATRVQGQAFIPVTPVSP